MPTFERSIEIAASPETVWSIVEDPSLIPKIFPDILTITADPPGKAHVGQKSTVVAKIAGRRMATSTETTEEHDDLLPFTVTSPVWDELRSDVRFTELLGKLGFGELRTI